jgi:hypothetical protein
MTEHTSPDDRLNELTTALPREIVPPPDMWPAILAELAPRSSRTLLWTSRWRVAAAVLLVAGSSSVITLLAVRANERGRAAATVAGAPSAPAGESRLPAHLAVAELGYERSIDALRRTLDERRDSLAPSTVATVERSLRIADSAIAEARSALEHDPANRVLADLLVSNYERKIDLLRRATELAPRT